MLPPINKETVTRIKYKDRKDPCDCCGDKATSRVQDFRKKWHFLCADCAAELIDGKIFIPRDMPHHGAGSPHYVSLSERAYHGDRFHSGEW